MNDLLLFTIVVEVKVLFTVELSSNVDIRPELVTEIQGLVLRQSGYRQEGVDLLCYLLTLQVLQREVNPGDELGRDVPGGGPVDEVPLLGVDLSTVRLLSQLSFRHGSGQHNDISWGVRNENNLF